MSNYGIAKLVSWDKELSGKHNSIIEIPDYLLEKLAKFTTENSATVSELIKKDSTTPILPAITNWLESFKGRINTSPGFICLKCKNSGFTDGQLRILYYLLARSLGILNDRYGILFDVKDRGLDYTKEAVPVSKTKASTGFHTDSTAKEYSPDIIGLLCIRPGYKGGDSLIVNGADLYCWFHDNKPQYLPFLTEPIVRDVITPGTTSNRKAIQKNKFPIFSFDTTGLKFRYMRYWITTGHEKTGIPLSEQLQEAMNYIDSYFNNEENSYKLKLTRGDMLFVNNRFLCHNRTAYEDWKEEDKKRTLVRTWINQTQ